MTKPQDGKLSFMLVLTANQCLAFILMNHEQGQLLSYLCDAAQ